MFVHLKGKKCCGATKMTMMIFIVASMIFTTTINAFTLTGIPRSTSIAGHGSSFQKNTPINIQKCLSQRRGGGKESLIISYASKQGSGNSRETSSVSSPKTYPALSKEEIQSLLDSIPLYAVTGSEEEGVILLKSPQSDNQIAYFFFNPEMANTVFAPLKQEMKEYGKEVNWSVIRFPLGFIWFELLNNPALPTTTPSSSSSLRSYIIDGIEYRLVPDTRDLEAARDILKQTNMQEQQDGASGDDASSSTAEKQLFQESYNEIPIFIDQFLRFESEDGGEKVPLYFGMQDLITTCQQALDSNSGEYQAAINISELHTLISEMQEKESTVNFREAVMIPPTPPQPTNNAAASVGGADGNTNNNNKMPNSKEDEVVLRKFDLPPERDLKVEKLDLPTATNTWDD